MFNYNKHNETEHNPKSTLIFRQEQILVIPPFFFLILFIFLISLVVPLEESKRGNKVK